MLHQDAERGGARLAGADNWRQHDHRAPTCWPVLAADLQLHVTEERAGDRCNCPLAVGHPVLVERCRTPQYRQFSGLGRASGGLAANLRMPLDIDGAAVLRAVVNAPDVFKDIQNDLNAFAHKIVVKQLKTKGTDVGRLRDVCRAVGEDNFRLIIDSLSDAGKSLSVKIDKHNADLKTAGRIGYACI